MWVTPSHGLGSLTELKGENESVTPGSLCFLTVETATLQTPCCPRHDRFSMIHEPKEAHPPLRFFVLFRYLTTAGEK